MLSPIDSRSGAGIESCLFHTPILSERLDLMVVPSEWMEFDEDYTYVHLLSYPFLFQPSVLVSYFRAINYHTMYKAFETASAAEYLAARATFTDPQAPLRTLPLQNRLRVAQNKYLFLDVRRNNILTDAMDQLWRRQRRELMRPLKVRIGIEEGEEGVDHGGVQQEFFRVAIAKALDPQYGSFADLLFEGF